MNKNNTPERSVTVNLIETMPKSFMVLGAAALSGLVGLEASKEVVTYAPIETALVFEAAVAGAFALFAGFFTSDALSTARTVK